MSAAKHYAHVAEIKRQLAAKYTRLAMNAKSTPRRKTYLYRAEKYSNQARMLSNKAQIK